MSPFGLKCPANCLNEPAPLTLLLSVQVVRLNQTSTLLRAVDLDSAENGPPFHFNVPAEYRYSNDFYLQDNLNGTATLTALRMFDRERQKEFLIPVIMSDSGRPAKTVTSTLTVTIGDQNDHAHVAGEKKIFISSHRGEIQINKYWDATGYKAFEIVDIQVKRCSTLNNSFSI